MIFSVDRYIDRITAISEPKAIKRAEWQKSIGAQPDPTFPSELEAAGFLVGRAQKRVQNAKAELKREQSRLKKCQKSFEAVTAKLAANSTEETRR